MPLRRRSRLAAPVSVLLCLLGVAVIPASGHLSAASVAMPAPRVVTFGDEPPPGKKAPTVAQMDVNAREIATASSLSAPARFGSRTGTGCIYDSSGNVDGTSGNRFQAVYAVSSDAPDRYNQLVADMRTHLRQADSVFVASAAKTGGTLQPRWVHDSTCQPTVLHLVIPPVTDSAGNVHRVDGTFGDTVLLLGNAGLTATNRDYVVWVDRSPNLPGADPICGITNSQQDPNPTSANRSNGGYTAYTRIDPPCFNGTNDAQNFVWSSVEAHEMMHALGAVGPWAPHGTNFGHCTDNADIMCYQDGSRYPNGTLMPLNQVCPPDQEPLFDCNNDDYFNTAKASFTSAATDRSGKPIAQYQYWNTANSSFLYKPPAPSGTISTPNYVMGESTPLTLNPSVPSGQGWRVDWSSSSPSTCTFDHTSSISDDVNATTNTILCPLDVNPVTVHATITQEDGQSSVVTLNTQYQGSVRATTAALTADSTGVTAGSADTLTAHVTDNVSGAGVYGQPVHFAILNADGSKTPVADATTDSTGTATATVTVDRSHTYTVDADAASIFGASSGSLRVAVQIPTTLNITAPSTYQPTGQATAFTASLVDNTDNPVAGATVTLSQISGTSSTVVDQQTTGSDGTAVLHGTASPDLHYQLSYTGTGDYVSAQSAAVSIRVSTPTTLTSTGPQYVSTGSTATVTGTLTGSNGAPLPGENVDLWTLTGSIWAHTSQGVTDANGAVSITDTPAASGSYQLRYTPGDAPYQSSASSATPFTLVQPTTLTATIPGSVEYGSSVTVTGTLTTGGTGLAGASVDLWQTDGTPAVVATSSPTDANGQFSVTITAADTHSYQLRYAANPTYGASASDVTVLHAVRTMTLSASTTTGAANYGDGVVVSGSLQQALPGSTAPEANSPVELWLVNPDGTATRVTSGYTDSAGTITFTQAASSSGHYELRYTGTPDTHPATADTSPITVSRPTTAALSMPSSLWWGTPTTVTGSLRFTGSATGLSGQPLSMYSTVAGQPSTLAATGTTDAAGNAQFTFTPTANATYTIAYPGAVYTAGSVQVSALGATSSAVSSAALRPMTSVTTLTAARVGYPSRIGVYATISFATGDRARVPGQSVQFWNDAAGRWTLLGTAITNSAGVAGILTVPTYNGTYLARALTGSYGGYVSYGADSAQAPVQVVVGVSRSASTSVHHYATYIVSGHVAPTRAGVLVWLYVDRRAVTHAYTDRNGNYAMRISYRAGLHYVFVNVPSTALNVGANSAAFYVRSW